MLYPVIWNYYRKYYLGMFPENTKLCQDFMLKNMLISLPEMPSSSLSIWITIVEVYVSLPLWNFPWFTFLYSDTSPVIYLCHSTHHKTSFFSLSNPHPWGEEPTHWKRPRCWERLRAGEEGDRGWNGWMASSTQWTWVWVNSGRWWRTGKPSVLQSMGSQRHDLATIQQQNQVIRSRRLFERV